MYINWYRSMRCRPALLFDLDAPLGLTSSPTQLRLGSSAALAYVRGAVVENGLVVVAWMVVFTVVQTVLSRAMNPRRRKRLEVEWNVPVFPFVFFVQPTLSASVVGESRATALDRTLGLVAVVLVVTAFVLITLFSSRCLV